MPKPNTSQYCQVQVHTELHAKQFPNTSIDLDLYPPHTLSVAPNGGGASQPLAGCYYVVHVVYVLRVVRRRLSPGVAVSGRAV